MTTNPAQTAYRKKLNLARQRPQRLAEAFGENKAELNVERASETGNDAQKHQRCEAPSHGCISARISE